MNEILEKVKAVYATFESEAAQQVEKGNKAAGTRARKASLELEKLMKEFRKASPRGYQGIILSLVHERSQAPRYRQAQVSSLLCERDVCAFCILDYANIPLG